MAEEEILNKIFEAVKLYNLFLLKIQIEEPEIKYQNYSIKVKSLPERLSDVVFKKILDLMLEKQG
ncbi:MAG: hypothetical protein ACKD6N_03545 [Candidatus Bathyarchaeota archaeon]